MFSALRQNSSLPSLFFNSKGLRQSKHVAVDGLDHGSWNFWATVWHGGQANTVKIFNTGLSALSVKLAVGDDDGGVPGTHNSLTLQKEPGFSQILPSTSDIPSLCHIKTFKEQNHLFFMFTLFSDSMQTVYFLFFIILVTQNKRNI